MRVVRGRWRLAPLLGGAIFQGLGASAPFLLGGALMGALLLAALRMLRPGREAQAPALSH